MRLNILSIALTLAGLSAAAPSLGFEIERQKNFTSNAAEPKNCVSFQPPISICLRPS